MKSKLLLFIIFLSASVLSSCKKDSQTNDNLSHAKKLTDIKVPEGFNWESSREISIKVNISDARFQNGSHVIAVYSPDGKLLSKGAASLNQPFISKVYLPNTINEVFVIKTAPDNSSTSRKVEINATLVELTMNEVSVGSVSSSKDRTFASGTDCSTGCAESVNLTANNQTITVSGGKTVCVSGSNKTFNVVFTTGGGTLRICGTDLIVADLSNNKINDPMAIIITEAASVKFDDKNKKATNFNQNNNRLENYGSLTFEDGINLAGVLKNNGTLTVNGEYSTETQTSPVTEHTNNGNLIVNGLLDVGSNSNFYNNGSVKATDLRVFNHSTFINNCKLWVTNEYDHSTLMKNYGYIRVDSRTFINGSSDLALYNGAMLSTKNIKVNGTIKGYNSTSLVKVLSETELTGAGLITGSVNYCDQTGIEKNNGTISGGVSLSCDIYIPVTGCNTEGNGSPVIKDTDQDGIPDNLDDYPLDATKAFNNYYPSADSDAGATVAFEDQWPVKGDYDMNDVVFSYRLRVITNAQNKVVEVDGTYDLQARGGIFQNGFGIEFPISRSLVSDVQGGILEEGQQKAVIVLFDNMHAEMLYFNTRKEDPVLPSKAFPISFKVNNGPTLAEFGLGEYNPFIWNKASGRGFEIHLPGKTPTSLANLSLFGTSDDASDPSKNRYYVTAEGYPWALSIPVKSFNYPLEGRDIITAYLKLPEWISSGGKSYTDWYSNQAAGYRNTNNLFK